MFFTILTLLYMCSVWGLVQLYPYHVPIHCMRGENWNFSAHNQRLVWLEPGSPAPDQTASACLLRTWYTSACTAIARISTGEVFLTFLVSLSICFMLDVTGYTSFWADTYLCCFLQKGYHFDVLPGLAESRLEHGTWNKNNLWLCCFNFPESR